jgi:hypothetical protein
MDITVYKHGNPTDSITALQAYVYRIAPKKEVYFSCLKTISSKIGATAEAV